MAGRTHTNVLDGNPLICWNLLSIVREKAKNLAPTSVYLKYFNGGSGW